MSGSSGTTTTVLGMFWFRRADYAGMLATLDDADALPRSYDLWLEHAEEARDLKQREGLVVLRVVIDQHKLAAIAREQRLAPGTAACGAIAAKHAAAVGFASKYGGRDELAGAVAEGSDVFVWWKHVHELLSPDAGRMTPGKVGDWARGVGASVEFGPPDGSGSPEPRWVVFGTLPR